MNSKQGLAMNDQIEYTNTTNAQEKATFSKIFARDSGICTYCRDNLKRDFDRFWSAQRDRLVPGGNYVLHNVVLTCSVCNNLRGNYTPDFPLTEESRNRYINDIRSRVMARRKDKIESDFASWLDARQIDEMQVRKDAIGDETLYEGRWLRMKRRGTWEYCERSHDRNGMAVIIAAVTPQDEVLFVEQFRVPLGRHTIEMPAGLVGDVAEDSLEAAARRELVEETGWYPHEVEVMMTGPTSAGMSNERIALVRARNLEKVGDGGGVDHENIRVHAIPRTQAPAWLMQKHAEGYELDLKLWGGLWMLAHALDGSALG